MVFKQEPFVETRGSAVVHDRVISLRVYLRQAENASSRDKIDLIEMAHVVYSPDKEVLSLWQLIFHSLFTNKELIVMTVLEFVNFVIFLPRLA